MDTPIQVRDGGVRELWRVSFPLMISFLSVVVMMFVDRLFLAWHSPGALNAAVTTGTLAGSFVWSWAAFGNMAEVFVAQYNGAKRYDKLGEPVWQMIYLSALSILFFLPMGLWGGDLFYGSMPDASLRKDYFNTIVYFGPLYPLLGALTGFYVGQAKTRVVIIMTLVANGLNIFLDWLFIFGTGDVIPAMGAFGAALATSLSMFVEVVLVAWMVFSRKNREKYGTGRWQFRWPAFVQNIKVGSPIAMQWLFELTGWALFYEMVTLVSPMHILVAGICQSVTTLFFFFGQGLEKGVASLVGNAIGAKCSHIVPRVLWSGAKLSSFFFVAILFFFVIYPDFFIDLFLGNSSMWIGEGTPDIDMDQAYSFLRPALALCGVYLFIETLRFSVNGALCAAGDTVFSMVASGVLLWAGLLTPVYIWIVKGHGSVLMSIALWIVFAVIACGTYYLRYVQGVWKGKVVVVD